MKFYRDQKYLINEKTGAIFPFQKEIAAMKNIRSYLPEVFEEDKAEAAAAKGRKKATEAEGA